MRRKLRKTSITSAELPLVAQPGVIYTSEETARILRVEPATLEVWRCVDRYPKLRWKKPAGRILYLGEDILEFLNSPHEKAQPYTPKSRRTKLAPTKPTKRHRAAK